MFYWVSMLLFRREGEGGEREGGEGGERGRDYCHTQYTHSVKSLSKPQS